MALVICSGVLPQLCAQQQLVDSIRMYTQLYNDRVEILVKEKLGDTFAAIGQMSVQDTATFDADSLQKLIDRGNKIIKNDPQIQLYQQKLDKFTSAIRRNSEARRKED